MSSPEDDRPLNAEHAGRPLGGERAPVGPDGERPTVGPGGERPLGVRAGEERLVVAAGERAVLVRCGSLGAVHALRRRVLAAALPGVVDVVPGWSSLLVVSRTPDPALVSRLAEFGTAPDVAAPDAVEPGPPFVLPTVYDGDDLAAVAAEVGCSVAAVVERHAAPTYTVAFLGFLAGFPYLAGLDPVLHVPRLAVPRVRVPAGSVAVAGSQAGVYPSEAPGGWRLLGTTAEVLFDPRADPPARLLPGDRVRFVPIEQPRVARARRPAEAEPAGGPVGPAGPAGPRGKAGRAGLTGPAGAVGAALRVVEVQPGCLVVDRAREGYAHLGVARSGPFDRAAHALGNRLVGNEPGAAGIEIPLGGLVVEAVGSVTVAVTGAEAAVHLTAAGGGDRASSPRVAIRLSPGERLHLGRPVTGARSYLAVRGGVATEVLLGGRSGTAVHRGDLLGVLLARDSAPPWFEAVPPERPHEGATTELKVVEGPDATLLPPGSLLELCRTPWQVDPASDRTGTRLAGSPVPAAQGDGTLPSGGVLPGFVQLLPSGHPVVLGPDCGTTGGYPVVAVVTDQALDRVAQLRPGDRVRFSARSLGSM